MPEIPLVGCLTKIQVTLPGIVHFFLIFTASLRHREVPRLRVQPELPLLVYTTATVTPDSSKGCDLHAAYHIAESLTH